MWLGLINNGDEMAYREVGWYIDKTLPLNVDKTEQMIVSELYSERLYLFNKKTS